MLRKGLYVFLIFISFSRIWATHVHVEMNSSTDEIEFQKEFVTCFVDAKGDLNIESVKKQSFQPIEDKFINDKLNQSYWLNFQLISNSEVSKKWVLEILDAHQELVEVYIFRKDSLAYYSKTGRNILNSKAQYGHKNHVLDFPINAKDSVDCYIKFKSSLVGSLLFKIRTNSNFASYAVKEYYFLGIYYGVLFLICLVNFILFILLRERIYVIYFIYVLAWILFSYIDDGLGSNFLWMEKPWIDRIGFYFMKPILIGSYVWYSFIFFKGKEIDRKVQQIIHWSLALYVVMQASEYFLAYSTNITTVIMFVPLALILHLSFKSYIKGYLPARFFILGNVFILLGFFIRFLQDMYIIRFVSYDSVLGVVTVYSRNIGVVLEIVTLTMALGDRFRFLKHEFQIQQEKLFEEYSDKQVLQTELIANLKENELLKDKVNRELENKVQERTKEIKAQSSELEVLNLKLQEQANSINEMNRLLDLDNYRLKKEVKVVNSNRALFKDISFEEFKLLYPDRLSVFRFLDTYKWKDGYVCRKCENNKFCDGNAKFSKRCTKCRYDESITAFTIFHKCKFPLEQAFFIVTKTVRLGNDLNVQTISDELDLRKNTVWNYKTKVLEAIELNKKHKSSDEFITHVILNPA